MVMKHLSHLNITGFRGQVALITTGHIGADGIMVAAVADTVIMAAVMAVEDIGAGLARGAVGAEVDLVEVVVVDLVEVVVADLVEEAVVEEADLVEEAVVEEAEVAEEVVGTVVVKNIYY
jgi:hypothetical protein